MDRAEEKAYRHLQKIGFREIVFEPDGNQTPDFSLNNNIAVEVTRLGQLHQGEKPHQEIEIPILQSFRNMLESFKQTTDTSYYVSLSFHPSTDWQQSKKEIKEKLIEFSRKPQNNAEFTKENNWWISIRKTSKPLKNFYQMSVFQNLGSGGAVAAEIIRSTNFLLEKKSKIACKRADEYSEWWLILLDNISIDILDNDEKEIIISNIELCTPWKKIIILSAEDLSIWAEIT